MKYPCLKIWRRCFHFCFRKTSGIWYTCEVNEERRFALQAACEGILVPFSVWRTALGLIISSHADFKNHGKGGNVFSAQFSFGHFCLTHLHENYRFSYWDVYNFGATNVEALWGQPHSPQLSDILIMVCSQLNSMLIAWNITFILHSIIRK